MLTETERTYLANVVSVISEKGGVGKTSLTTHVARELAGLGYRVLVIDLDPQGHVGLDLSYAYADGTETNFAGDPIADDEGESLALATAEGTPITRITVRENLDAIAAGRHTRQLARWLTITSDTDPDRSRDSLAHTIAKVAHDYSVILMDCPPGDSSLQEAALNASRWVIVPAGTDDGSVTGLEALIEAVNNARTTNPQLGFLGAALIGFTPAASRMREDQRTAHQNVLDDAGEPASVFNTVISYAPAAAGQARARGQVMSELAQDAEREGTWVQRLAQARQAAKTRRLDGAALKAASPQLSKAAKRVAGEWSQLTGEIIERIQAAAPPQTRRSRRKGGQDS